MVFACLLAVFLNQENAVLCAMGRKKLPIYSVDRQDNKIAITFDCAWGTEYTDEILRILGENDVRSTFFMVEFWVHKNSDYVKKIAKAGHEIGTHSKTHKHMPTQSYDEIMFELKSSKDAIENITNTPVTLFRPPFGDYDDKLITCAEKMSLFSIQWDVDSLDWKDISKDEIVSRVVKKTKSGSIILCHNNGKNTAKALLEIITKLKDKGYEFVTVGELIYKENFQIDLAGIQHLGR